MHEDEMTDRFPAEHVKGQIMAVKFYFVLKVLSKIGVLKILSGFKKFPGFSATISPFSKQTQKLLWRTSFQKKTIAAMHSEFSNVQDGYRKVRGMPATEIPLIVIKSVVVNEFYPGTSEDTKRIIREKLREAANDLKNWSVNGKLVEASGSGHNIHIENPQIVVDSILEILRTALLTKV